MSASPFLTFAEVASYLRYELDAKGADALRKWLAKYGIRPSLKRGLYRLVQIEAAIERIDAAQARRRNRGFKAHAARFQQRNRALHRAHVSGEGVGHVHAANDANGIDSTRGNCVVSGGGR